MNINRQNYEEYFLLYLDKELAEGERQEVEAFIAAHPDLASELEALRQFMLHPDDTVVFGDKATLMKSEQHASPVHAGNYEEYFLLYTDNELNQEEKGFVEQFIHDHPEYGTRLDLLQQAKLVPDTATVFADKSTLYRRANDGGVIVFRWWRMAAAAIIILFLGIGGWYSLSYRQQGSNMPVAVHTDRGRSRSSTNENKNVPASPDMGNSSPASNEKKLAITGNGGTTNRSGIQRIIQNGLAEASRPDLQETKQRKFPDPNTASARKIKRNALESNAVLPAQELNRSTASAKRKNTDKSNGLRPANVLHKSGNAPEEPVNAAHDIAVNAVTELKVAGNEQTRETTMKEESLSYAINNPDDDAVFVAAVNSKSRLRGLVRKVTRVFEKTTNIEPADKGLRIANFEIGLK